MQKLHVLFFIFIKLTCCFFQSLQSAHKGTVPAAPEPGQGTGKQPDLQPPLTLGASLFALKGGTGEENYYWQPGKNLSRKEEHTYFPSRAPSSSCWQMQPLEFSPFMLLLTLSRKSQFHWRWGQTCSAVSLKQGCPRDYICRVSHTDTTYLKLACSPVRFIWSIL